MKLSLNQSIFSIGSCFSEMIAGRLSEHKWDVTTNPFGTLFDPVSIERNIINSLSDAPISDDMLDQREDVVFHYNYHSDLSALSVTALSNLIEEAHNTAKMSLLRADWIILTYGSAVIFRHNTSGQPVANCHKMPGDLFTREMLPLAEVSTSLLNTIAAIKKVNARARFVLTVSPVRHLRHGREQNMLSKSILRLACQELTERHADQVCYFPSFEIMMDELRDYKYYQVDKVHPTEEAENIIWEHFQESMLDEEARTFVHQWSDIRKAMAHKPRHVQSSAHQRFLKETLVRLERLSGQVDVSAERAHLEKQLI